VRERERERERAKCAVSRVAVLKVEGDKISSYNLQVKGRGTGAEKARVSVTNHFKRDLTKTLGKNKSLEVFIGKKIGKCMYIWLIDLSFISKSEWHKH